MRPSLSSADECTAVPMCGAQSLAAWLCLRQGDDVRGVSAKGLQLVAAAAWVPQPALRPPLRPWRR